jgi:enamidase
MIELDRYPGLFPTKISSFTGLIRNIGCLISGDLENPILDDDCIGIKDGKIDFMCDSGDVSAEGFDFVIDARQTTVFPGLIDSHVHPTMGQYSPRADNSFWISHCLHGPESVT